MQVSERNRSDLATRLAAESQRLEQEAAERKRAEKAAVPRTVVTPARAREIIQAAKAKARFGPWSDQLDKVMTAPETTYVKDVWGTKPGHWSFVDTIEFIARGGSRGELNRVSWGGREVFPREFYLPKEVRGKAPIEIGDLQVWTYEHAGREGRTRYVAIAFAGKAQKPLWHHNFATSERRDQYIIETMKARKGIRKRKEAATTARREYKHDFKVGDIFSTSWGYDQTNVEFYEVVEVRGAILVVREIGQNVVSEGSGSDKVTAVPGKFIGKPLRVRPTAGYVTIEGHHASKWTGGAKYKTAFGWGH
jgi:hypothetical protein